jgi:cytochrome P450
MSATALLAPSPAGLPLVGNLLGWLRDPFGNPTAWARAHGDVVRMRAPGGDGLMVFHPDLVQETLVTRAADYRKPAMTRAMVCITGPSVVTLSGDPWLRRRRLLEPAFKRDRLARYAPVAGAHAGRYLARWLRTGAAEVRGDMLDYLFDVMVDVTTDMPLGPDRAVLKRGFEVFWGDFCSGEFMALAMLTNGDPYRFFATPRRRRQVRLLADFGAIVERLAAHADAHPDGDTLLCALRPSWHQAGGLDPTELRDDVVTLILAAQETTGVGLTMALDLLARHPDVQDALCAELGSVLGERPPGFDDLSRLPLLDAVVREALRLHPPIWGISREALRATEVGGYPVRAGQQVIASAWVVQRDPRFWGADAGSFRPARWLEPSEARRGAWFPFGAGAHQCIGMRFAMVEMALALATWCRGARFAAVGPPPTLKSVFTIHPTAPMPLRVTAR